jgi:hypothetical protein
MIKTKEERPERPLPKSLPVLAGKFKAGNTNQRIIRVLFCLFDGCIFDFLVRFQQKEFVQDTVVRQFD